MLNEVIQSAATWLRLRRPAFSVTIPTALLICFLGISAPTRAQDRSQLTESQTRQTLLQEIEAGQLQEAILLGQQSVSRWPGDGQLRHYLDPPQACIGPGR